MPARYSQDRHRIWNLPLRRITLHRRTMKWIGCQIRGREKPAHPSAPKNAHKSGQMVHKSRQKLGVIQALSMVYIQEMAYPLPEGLQIHCLFALLALTAAD